MLKKKNEYWVSKLSFRGRFREGNFSKQCLTADCRGSGGDSGTGRFLCKPVGRLQRPTFERRRKTWCMLPRSRAGEKVARATFRRKTQWFRHTFPLSPESGPGGSRELLGGSRGSLEVLPGLSGDGPRGPSGILLPGFLLQVSSSGIPPQGILPWNSSSRISR